MPVYEVLLIAISMAMDAFAVCLVAGSLNQANGGRSAFRLSFHFGLFQFIMPVLGWVAGRTLEPLISNYDHWIALGLVAFIGVRMIVAALRGEEAQPPDPSRGWTLVALSVAVSIDALAVGLSLGVIKTGILYPAAVIGVVCFAMTIVGARLGPVVGRVAGRWAELLGGLILIGIGIRILVEHIGG